MALDLEDNSARLRAIESKKIKNNSGNLKKEIWFHYCSFYNIINTQLWFFLEYILSFLFLIVLDGFLIFNKKDDRFLIVIIAFSSIYQ